MDAVLTRLKELTADQLREEFARADLKCGPITATTRAIFERKLARALAGPERSSTDSDDGSPDDLASVGDHVVPLPCAKSTDAVSRSSNEELDFGYGVGLNPPEEDQISAGACNSSSCQPAMESTSKDAQVPPAFYYGVCPLWEDILSRNERSLVYTDKKDALQAVKVMKGARFKAFSNREDAEKFAKGMCDYFPSTSKSTACVSPVKPGQVFNKDNMEVDTINRERANSFKSPRTQDLTTKLRKPAEKGDEAAFSELVWSNPRYLIGSGDNPTIVQEGCRYNAMHVAAKENQAGIAQLLLDTLENPEFMRLMYPDDDESMLQKRIRYIVDLYLNTPDKAGFETPLHFACKFGCPEVVNVLCSHPDTDKNRKNKDDLKPCDIICSRKSQTPEVKQKISDYLEDRCYVPLLRAADNSSQPIIGSLWSPESSERLSLIQRHTKSPMDPLMTVTAFAGPLSPSKADDFRRSWKTPPRNRGPHFHNILKSDPDRGAERVGRDLAHELGHPWAEYWDFLDSFVDLSSTEGLHKMEEYLSKRDFCPRTREEAENENSNRFRTPSPGKLKKFCNSISVGAFLDEGEDISLEEMKNRQNAALTSITSSAAAASDSLKGAVGGHDFRILPMAPLYRGADLIETAAERDPLCCCDDGLLSPGAVCQNQVCASSTERTLNGDEMFPQSSQSSCGLLSPVSNLMVEFERMSLQEPSDADLSTDLSSGPKGPSLGHGSPSREVLKGGGGAEERPSSSSSSSSSSSEEFFQAEDGSSDITSRTRGANVCARSKSWDHGGRDLSSSGSSTSSYKSLDNSHEFLPRTPPHVRKGLFIMGASPSKLDRQVLSALEGVEVESQTYPSIHKWMSTIKSFSASDMQSWPSPAVGRPGLGMQHQTPGSPAPSGPMSPSARLSPAFHSASPDFSPSRFSPANAGYMQRILLKHLNQPSV